MGKANLTQVCLGFALCKGLLLLVATLHRRQLLAFVDLAFC